MSWLKKIAADGKAALEDKSMLQKKDRTIDEYKRAGAEMRLFKELSAKLVVDLSKVLSAPDFDKMHRALRRIDEVCSRAEDNMFHDYPKLGNDYLSVFYGSVGDTPRNAVDEEIIEVAKKVAGGLFERKDN